MSNSTFTVSMHPDLVNDLDETFSPIDGLVAIGQVFGELPSLHAAIAPKRMQKQAGRTLKVYRARFDWYPLGVSYVQIGTTLHVVELWVWDKQMDVNLVLKDQETWGPQDYSPTENELTTCDAIRKQDAEKCDSNFLEDDNDPYYINF